MAQLKVGGTMILPVGQSGSVQSLVKVVRTDTQYNYQVIREVRFVPLVEGLGKDS